MAPPPAAPTRPPGGARVDAFLRGGAVALLAAVLFGMVNYIAARHYHRWDWTSARLFTLSPRSRAIVRGLHNPVDLYVLLNQHEAHDSTLYADVAELAERYAAESPRVRLHYIDPDRQREQLIGLSQQLDLRLLQNRETGQALSSAAVVAVEGTRHWEVPRTALAGVTADAEGDTSAHQLAVRITVERALSEALLQVDRVHPTRLCFATGHEEMPLATGDRSGAGLAEDLRHHLFQVQEVEVHGQTGVPATCDALVVAGPQRTWSTEDAAALERYLRAGGNVALFVDLVVLEGRIAPTGLESVLRLGGVEALPALTIEADPEHLIPHALPVRFTADTWNEHEITGGLRTRAIIASMVRPLRRAPSATVVPSAIVQTTPAAWGEVDVADLVRTSAPNHGPGDVAGPITLALAAEVPGVARPTAGQAAGRMVVVGTSAVLSADFFTPEGRGEAANADMVEAMVGWLTARRELVEIPSRPASAAALNVSQDGLWHVLVYVVFLVPLAAALVGVAVWRARKHAS